MIDNQNLRDFIIFCQILEQTQSKLSRDNFSFSAKAIVGTFLQAAPAPYATDGEYIRMTDTEVAKRLEEVKMFTRQTLNVEQRIEIARQQQAIREAKKLAKEELAKSKEKARHARELEKNERLEAQRKERELRNQQAAEVFEYNLFYFFCVFIINVEKKGKKAMLIIVILMQIRLVERNKKNWRKSNRKNYSGNNRYAPHLEYDNHFQLKIKINCKHLHYLPRHLINKKRNVSLSNS